MRSRSVVAPDRRPWPCSARRTQWRSVSPEQPIFSAIEWIADHWEVCSAWWSRTIRTARARTSGEYGGTRFVMAPSSQESEPPENPVRFSAPSEFDLGRFMECERGLSHVGQRGPLAGEIAGAPATSDPGYRECCTVLSRS